MKEELELWNKYYNKKNTEKEKAEILAELRKISESNDPVFFK